MNFDTCLLTHSSSDDEKSDLNPGTIMQRNTTEDTGNPTSEPILSVTSQPFIAYLHRNYPGLSYPTAIAKAFEKQGVSISVRIPKSRPK